jgi:N-acetylneuraminate synthase
MNVKIGNREVGNGQPCFVVAEIGINHNGDLGTALQLIDVAVKAGCDAVKFQVRTVPVVYSETELVKPRAVHRTIIDSALKRKVLSAEAEKRIIDSSYENTTNGDLKNALELTSDEYEEIGRYCLEKSILWSVSPWDEASVERVASFNLPFVKVASASLTDDNLLRKVRSLGVPVLLSTGMSTMEEVKHAVHLLGENDLVLLHTVSVYPADEEDLNLAVIMTLRSEFPGIPIGYSGHERGTTLSVAAVALGACVVERHITLDRTMPGSDHAASLEPGGIGRVVTNIRRLEKAMGNGVKTLYPKEIPIKAKLRRV